MPVNTLTVLGNTVHGVPSGNYDGSSMDFDSDGAKAVAYYRGQGSIQTVGIRVENFTGIITIQATLDQDWQASQWVDVYTYSDGIEVVVNDYHPVTLTGNYTWVRAKVTDFSAGTIQFINITY